MKKTLSCFLALCMILSLTLWGVGAAEEEEPQMNYAQASFDGSPSVRISALTPVEGNDVYDVRDGVRVLKLGQNGGGPNYMAINVEDGFLPPEQVKYLNITVRYYDEGNGWFGLRYNKNDETFRWNLTDTHTWMEHTFYLEDATLENRCSRNSDMLLAGWLANINQLTPDPVYVQWVRIQEGYPAEPVKLNVTSDHTGNIFDGDDLKKLTLKAENILETQADCVLNYRVLDRDGNFLNQEGSLSFTAEGGETVEKELTVGVSRYGIYKLETQLEVHGEYRGTKIDIKGDPVCYDFSVMNKFRPGEQGNRMLSTNSHHGTLAMDAEYTVDLYREAGLTGTRDEYRWSRVETQPGAFDISFAGDFVTPFADSGQETMLILDYGNPLYTPGYNNDKIMPDNSLFSGYEEKFLQYVDYITKKFKGKVAYYELWNEPNMVPNFNALNASAEQYAALLKKVYPIVKKNDPNAKVVAMSTAFAAVDYVRAALKAGAGEYMDAGSFHPYIFNMDFNGDRYKNIINQVRNVYTECGYPDMPLLFTEVGVCAWHESGLWPNDYAAGAEMAQIYAITQGESLTERLYIFQYVNAGPSIHWADGTQEQRWGLVNHRNELVPYSAHPGAITTAAYNKLVGNAESQHHDTWINDDGKRTYIYHFKRELDGKDVLICWTECGSDTFGINLGTQEASVYDMYSNLEGTLHATDGVFTLTTSFEPLYLVGEFTDFARVEEKISTNGGRFTAIQGDNLILHFQDAAGRTLRAEVAAEENLALQENGKTEPGDTELIFKIGNKFTQEDRVLVKLFDGEDMVYLGVNHIVETDTPINFNAVIGRHSDKVVGRDVLNLSLSNATQGFVLNGTVTVDLTGIGGKKQVMPVTGLQPGVGVDLRYNLPVSHSKSVMELDVQYDFEGMPPGTQKVLVTPEFNCAYAETPPPIQGSFSRKDWSGSDWVGARDAYAAKNYVGWSGPEEASMEAIMLWDEDNLYLLVEAVDDVFYNIYEGANSWRGDGIQFGIKNDTESQTLNAGNASVLTFTEIAIYRGMDGTGKLYRNVSQFENLAVGEAQGEANIEMIGGKWIYRAAIPWIEILGEGRPVKAGDVMHLGMLLNDNDGQGRSYMEFCQGIATNKSPDKFSTMTLLGKE